MSIFYKLRKHQRGMSNDGGMYYAHTVKQGEWTLRDIESRIQANCTLKRSDVRAVLAELVDVMKDGLQSGYVISLGEVGKFQLVVRSSCVKHQDDFTPEHIRGLTCRFTPYAHRNAKGQLIRYLFDGCRIAPQR